MLAHTSLGVRFDPVSKLGPLVVMLVLVACGRIGSDAPLDAGTSDASLDGAGATDAGLDGAETSDAAGEGTPPSCRGLANTCGPTGVGSCCDSPLVRGGTYARSYDASNDAMHPDPSFPATVSDFRLDKYEVTVGRFRRFVAAGQGTRTRPPVPGAGAHPLIANSGWDASWNDLLLVKDTAALVAEVKCHAMYQTWTDTPGENESLAMNCITWTEAMAFCAWDGGFVPTEAEWNYAASGGSEQRPYPWSSPPDVLRIDCSYANIYYDSTCVNPPAGAVNRVGSQSPKGDGKWGQSDLAGNVVEWTLDWHAPYANPCADCANLTSGAGRELRGGYFAEGSALQRVAGRGYGVTGARPYPAGVRCARTP